MINQLAQAWLALEDLWPSLTNSERVRAHKAATAAMWQTLQIPWTPLPGKQWQATKCLADELFYGGQAGGAKSQLVLGLASTAHSKSRIFRREYVQLAGATGLVETSKDILNKTGAHHAEGKGWRNIPGGRSIEFASVQRARDWEKYAGRSADFIGFDELPQFLESQYRALIGWNRTDDPDQRCRVVATGNPPTTAEGRWVLEYWGPWLKPDHPNPAQPGELRWYTRIDDRDVEVENGEPFNHHGEMITPKSRTFIPARLADNPYLMLTDYGARLQALPEPLRSQMLHGDFAADVKDDDWQLIPTAWVKAAQARWTEEPPEDVPLTAIGSDQVRGGRDQLTIAGRHDNWFTRLRKWPGKRIKDGPIAAAQIIKTTQEWGGDGTTPIYIDVGGVGGSPYDSLVANEYAVIGVNFASGSRMRDRSRKLKMSNKRAELWYGMREALDPEYGDDIALPPDAELLADLTAPRWTLTVRGVLVESKEKIKDRIGRSTDCGDAVILCASRARSYLL